MVKECLPGIAEYRREFRPVIRSGHVDNPHCFYPGFWRLDAKQARGLAALDTAPELSFGSDDEVLIERIGMDGDLDPFAAAGDHREHRRPGRYDPHIMLQLRHIFLGRGLL